MIYIINTDDEEKKKYLDDFLSDNQMVVVRYTDNICRAQKVEITAKLDCDFTKDARPCDLGLFNIEMKAVADMKFLYNLAAFFEQTIGHEIKCTE